MVYTFHSSGHILQIITITPKLWPKQRAYESLHFSFVCLCSTDRSRTLIRSSLSRCCLPTSLSINACSDTKTWHGTEIMSDRVPGWWVILVCLKKGVFWICFCFFLKKGNLKNVYMREVQMGGDRWHSTRDYNKKKKDCGLFSIHCERKH